jgi:hypothetical protein
MPTILEKDSADHLCPFNDFAPCFGKRCMAWVWHGRTADVCETDNLQMTEEGERPIGDAKLPPGDGWMMDGGPTLKGYHRSAKDKLPPAIQQRWVRPLEVTRGQCSRTQSQDYPW